MNPVFLYRKIPTLLFTRHTRNGGYPLPVLRSLGKVAPRRDKFIKRFLVLENRFYDLGSVGIHPQKSMIFAGPETATE